MAEIEEVHAALFSWGLQHAVITEEVIRQNTTSAGDPSLIPFDLEHADFFRTRKIVKISHARQSGVETFSLATRLPIARAKRETLITLFAHFFADDGMRLVIEVHKAFKIDQNVQSTFQAIYSHQGRIACGSSIGLGNQRNAGTLSALIKHAGGKLYGMSCNHVTGGCNTASVGTPVVAPGIQDVGPDHHEITVIGLHDSTGPMSQGLPSITDVSTNTDLAFFEITAPDLISSMQGEGDDAYDTPTQFVTAKEKMRVKKWGRSTKLTHGEVKRIIHEPEAIEYKVVSYFGPTSSQSFTGTVYFTHLLEISSLSSSAFSAGGDSGALVVTSNDKSAVGILIGGNNQISYVLPIAELFKRRKFKLQNQINA